MINIAVLGHGVVGSGVVELFNTNGEFINKSTSEPIFVKKILDLREFDVPYKDKFTKDYDEIVNDEEISIVVEVMGGVHPAYEFVKRALENKKSVVTSNKELVAQKGAKLLKLAKENNVNFYFEASVGGGIPIIRPLHLCLSANKIKQISGILNGTTNYVLTKMIKENMDFDTALKQAQDLGYAERNPSADIDGHDSCRKICILASLAYGKHIYPEQVNIIGISKITLEDVEYANLNNSVIKLIGTAKTLENSDKIECFVTPAMVDNKSRLSSIEDVFNGILVRGNALGDVVFYGRGAGKLPTASAVVADIINVANADKTTATLSWEDTDENYVIDYSEVVAKNFLRIKGTDISKEMVEDIFGQVKFIDNEKLKEIAFITDLIKEKDLSDKIKLLEDKGAEIISVIKVLDC